MKEDKAFIVRKLLTIVSLVLIFATAGLLAITTQLKTITLQNKIYLNENATVEPSTNSRVKNGMVLTITSDTEKAFDVESVRESYSPIVASVKQEVEAIPFEEERVNNAEVDLGTNSFRNKFCYTRRC